MENFSDKEIWEYAKRENFIIVTFDADFYHFSIVRQHLPKIIWIRSISQSTNVIEALFRKHLLDIQFFNEDATLSCLELMGKTQMD
nr:DUF5615 family PIN-like protein [Algoriphagus yeomjeoni]